jgi:hypothetical protein
LLQHAHAAPTELFEKRDLRFDDRHFAGASLQHGVEE